MLEWAHGHLCRHTRPARRFLSGMPGPELKTEAIVMGSHKLREADRVVTLFTERYGRLPAVVKGVRKVGSRFGGRLEPFTLLNVSLHRGRSLFTLTAADTLRTRDATRSSPGPLKAGLSVVDLAARTSPEQERRRSTYNLLNRFFEQLETTEPADSEGLAALTLAAELKLLLLAGFLPHLSSCAGCGGKEMLGRFSASAGGLVCPDCGADGFVVSAEAVDAMRLMLERPLAEAAQTGASEPFAGEIWRCLKEICLYHLDIRLKVAPW